MEKYVKLMADYCSSGVWESNGIMMSIDDLPVSDTLKMTISDWVRYYETNDSYLGEDGYGDLFDVQQFSEQGLNIAKAIKQELPEWRVMYYDERVFAEHYKQGVMTPAVNTVYEVL